MFSKHDNHNCAAMRKGPSHWQDWLRGGGGGEALPLCLGQGLLCPGSCTGEFRDAAQPPAKCPAARREGEEATPPQPKGCCPLAAALCSRKPR